MLQILIEINFWYLHIIEHILLALIPCFALAQYPAPAAPTRCDFDWPADQAGERRDGAVNKKSQKIAGRKL